MDMMADQVFPSVLCPLLWGNGHAPILFAPISRICCQLPPHSGALPIPFHCQCRPSRVALPHHPGYALASRMDTCSCAQLPFHASAGVDQRVSLRRAPSCRQILQTLLSRRQVHNMCACCTVGCVCVCICMWVCGWMCVSTCVRVRE